MIHHIHKKKYNLLLTNNQTNGAQKAIKNTQYAERIENLSTKNASYRKFILQIWKEKWRHAQIKKHREREREYSIVEDMSLRNNKASLSGWKKWH